MEQAHSSVMYSVDDDLKRWAILQAMSPLLSELSPARSPAYNSTLVLHRTAQLIGITDPYAAAKKASNQTALAMVPKIMDRIRASSDKLQTAVRLSVVGNVIDLGIKHQADLDETMDLALGNGFTRFDYDKFKQKLDSSKRILFIADNAGEIVFDKILIEGLKAFGKQTVAAVKGGPVLNDATMEDALAVGLDKVVKVIDNGSNWVGVNRDKCSNTFLKVLDTADMVIAKGQGNYETLDEMGGRFFFILKAKCDHVARALGVQKGDLALAAG